MTTTFTVSYTTTSRTDWKRKHHEVHMALEDNARELAAQLSRCDDVWGMVDVIDNSTGEVLVSFDIGQDD